MQTRIPAPLAIIAGAAMTSCSQLPADDGASTSEAIGRRVRASDIAVPGGYSIEAVATGLMFPTGVVTDEQGRVYVTEAGYSYGEVWGQARLLRVDDDGGLVVVATGGHPPWNGVDYAGGAFFIAEGGDVSGGRILRLDARSAPTSPVVLVDNLPSLGDHHTCGPVVGRDGFVYFGQGSATNSGIVGPDNLQIGWLERHPDFHDIPGQDITLAGVNVAAPNWLDPLTRQPVMTGAFAAFGSVTTKDQVVKGRLPCTGAVMRIPVNGGPLELVAWGLHNPFGLAFSPDTRLFVTESSGEPRGSRPIAAAPDVLWRITSGSWYGWPDYQAGEPVFNAAHRAPGSPTPTKLLAKDPGTPPKPAARLGTHSASHGMDFSRSDRFGFAGQAFVAEFGDMAPAVGKALSATGFRVVRVDVRTGEVRDFVANVGGGADGQNGPASRLGGRGLERPIAVKFSRDGSALYVVDFGVMNVTRDGVEPVPGTGVLWKVTRSEPGGVGVRTARAYGPSK
jgi:glucose/arabinose dehydrogenase